jgi:hypothetical protein
MSPTHFYAHISKPSERNPTGSVAEGFYVVKKRTVLLTDSAGVPLPGEGNQQKLEPKDDPRTIAIRLLKAKEAARARRHSGPIRYPALPDWM